MDLFFTAAVLFAVLAAAAAAGLAASRLVRARYRELLTAIATVQRQLTELRSRQDELAAHLATLDERLARGVESDAAALARHRRVAETAAEVRRARDAGGLEAAPAGRLLGHLAELADEIAAGLRPY